MDPKRLADFDSLIGGYYGKNGQDTDPRKRVQDLLSTYYGNPAAALPGRSRAPSVSLSLGCDDGEVLSQPVQAKPRPATGQAVSLDFEEYVIDICDAPRPTPQRASAPALPEPPPPAEPPPPVPPAPAAAPAPAASAAAATSLSQAEADIVNDLQSIIRGQKVYEKERGLVDRSTATSTSTDAGGQNAPYPGMSGQPGNPHAIFDRIKKSMQYANAYDLGTVELENRFAEFDRQEDERRRAAQKKSARSAAPPPPTPSPARTTPSSAGSLDTADFMADLDTIKSTSALPAPVPSRPFYDTGEHVLAGNGQYADLLRVGKGQAVRLSYGQIIAMGDLYNDVDDLLKADPAELTRLKTLIVRNTAYYEGKRANPKLDVSNDDWDDATQGRFLKLAEKNYEHFSPPTVAMGSGLKATHGDNRTQWEKYHRRAIESAQQESAAQGANASSLLERSLIINAFGDHFLTDAFAAGHLINKDVMIGRFRSAFYSGSGLSGAAEKFFERVADAAWKDANVSAEFSKLETVDWAHWHGIWLPFHPDIDRASRLGAVLKEAAKQQPERVGNLIVKALHDYLNKNGIEVANRAGDGAWFLPGDGTLMIGTGNLTPADLAKNLGIMRKAVQQSIDDINSPSIRGTSVNFQALFDGVWRYVPQLTGASAVQMQTLIHDYTDPTSSVLVRAAAEILTDQLKSFIKVLLSEHKLRLA